MNTPLFDESRLMQIKAVERIVRPIIAPTHHKRKMREELLAHLEVIYSEELEHSKDPALALQNATRRLGEPALLTRELQASLPSYARLEYRIERWFGWRAPESAFRYTLRSSAQLFGIMALIAALYIAGFVFRIGWSQADWIVIRAAAMLAVILPVDALLLGLLYFKIRDIMWGAFGSKRSFFRAILLGIPFALVAAGSTFAFTSMATSHENWANQHNIYPAVIVGIAASLASIAVVRAQGQTEIADAAWECLEI